MMMGREEMHWLRTDSSDFGGDRIAPRSRHNAVSIGKSKVVVFGGFIDKRFLADYPSLCEQICIETQLGYNSINKVAT